MDQYVIGQDSAKVSLAVAVYNHYKRIQFGLVDLVHINNAVFRQLHIVVRRLKEAQEDVLHVVAHVARLGEGGGVGNGKGHLQYPGSSSRRSSPTTC